MSLLIKSDKGTFKLGKKIGSGSFGEIYYGINTDLDETHEDYRVAIKLEHSSITPKLLITEGRYYTYLYRENSGIPKIYWSGTKDDYTVMIMELMGPSLECLLRYSEKKFDVTGFDYKTICYIAVNILKIIKYIHSRGLIHRDIKPDNLLIGYNNNNIYMIDYGLCKLFKTHDGKHIEYVEGKKLIGSLRYMSINCHKCIELSRRDDLESIGYMLVYLLKGALPWQSIKNGDNKNDLIRECKEKVMLTTLCDNIPPEYLTYFTYISKLQFKERPDYDYLINLFASVQLKNKWNNIPVWDS
jgi:casein kinase 1 epsilon